MDDANDQTIALTSELVEAMASAHPTEIHEAISRTLTTVHGVDSARVWLADMGYTQLHLMGSTDTVPVDGTILGRCFDSREVIETEGRLLIPVDSLGRVLGVLEIEGVAHVVRDRAASIATVIADRVIGSKGHSDVVEKIRGADKLDIAATIQHGLMPIPSYEDARVQIGGQIEPAYDIAGDGFDYSVNEGVIDIALFDAVGHGLRSTLLTTVTLGTYRLHRRRGANLTEIADEIDRALVRSADNSEFVTGLLGRLYLADLTFEIANAGHLPPIMIRSGRAIEFELEPALPFGLERKPHERRIVSLQPGDAVYLFSDGIVEAHDGERSPYGNAELTSLLEHQERDQVAVPVVCRRVLDSVKDHVVEHLKDDATVVGLRVAGI